MKERRKGIWKSKKKRKGGREGGRERESWRQRVSVEQNTGKRILSQGNRKTLSFSICTAKTRVGPVN